MPTRKMIPDQMQDGPSGAQFKILIDTKTTADELPKGRLPNLDELKRGFPAPAIAVKIFRMFQRFVNAPTDQEADTVAAEIETFLKLTSKPVTKPAPEGRGKPVTLPTPRVQPRGKNVVPPAKPDPPKYEYELNDEELDEVLRWLDRTQTGPLPESEEVGPLRKIPVPKYAPGISVDT